MVGLLCESIPACELLRVVFVSWLASAAVDPLIKAAWSHTTRANGIPSPSQLCFPHVRRDNINEA